jgi:hypothetical protein
LTIHTRIDQQEFANVSELRETVDTLRVEQDYIESIRTWPWRPTTLSGVLTAVALPLLIGLLLEILPQLFNF